MNNYKQSWRDMMVDAAPAPSVGQMVVEGLACAAILAIPLGVVFLTVVVGR